MLSRKNLISTIFYTAFIILIGFSLKGLYEPQTKSADSVLAPKILNECQMNTLRNRQSCLANKILAEIDKNPSETDNIFTGLWQLAIVGKLQEDPRMFSDITHVVGMMLAEKDINLVRAFSFCGKTFKQGCMHVYVMESVDHKYPQDVDVKTLKNMCEVFTDPVYKNNCIHGVGHELAAKIKENLPTVLELCKNFTSKDAQYACESGVLMEFTKGTAGIRQSLRLTNQR